ncbi:LacI family DNA-binding transcriptional regulator [Mediterraneibacter gnavus]
MNIKEIAQLAGVSTSTVSKIVNQKTKVSVRKHVNVY